MVTDKLFLLSKSDVELYLLEEKNRICEYDGKPCWWWLRSPGCYPIEEKCITKCINISGFIDRYGYSVRKCDNAVRPALHLNPDYLKSLKRNKGKYIWFGGRKWIVLIEDVGLLLSKNAVCFRRFDAETNDYEKSKIREFLNGELFNQMFTVEEQKQIVDTVISGEVSYPAVV